ncbi:hypothetical protein [Wolbachia endosymbiont of Chironomus riparius]|uniref:hypothetical protein n=1 Tax=Wolbachia endosymbiont of Chironomus riparius TaxID=2883238 RepID=UPI00209E7F50|nr:hypothetical protein [Wolbachia endosymbiont of Chironomus riparius]
MTEITFGTNNKYKIDESTSFVNAISTVYKEESKELGASKTRAENILGRSKAVLMAPVVGTVNYSIHHPGRVAAVVLPAIAVAALTASYFMFPAYAAFVGAYAAKAGAFVAPAISGISGGISAGFMLAAANPMLTGILAIVAVAAVAAIGSLAYIVCNQKSIINDKDEIINGMKKQIKENCEVQGEGTDNETWKIKDGVNLRTVLEGIGGILSLNSSVNQVVKQGGK